MKIIMKRDKTPVYIDTALYNILRHAYEDEVGVPPKKEELESEITELLVSQVEYANEMCKLGPLTILELANYTDKDYVK